MVSARLLVKLARPALPCCCSAHNCIVDGLENGCPSVAYWRAVTEASDLAIKNLSSQLHSAHL